MNPSSLSHLTATEQAAIAEYIAHLRHHFADHVQAVTLFGSKARGDAHAESDLDLLVVVDVETNQLRTNIWHIAADIGLAYNLVLSARIFSQTRWEEMARLRLPLYRAIMAEGIPVGLPYGELNKKYAY